MKCRSAFLLTLLSANNGAPIIGRLKLQLLMFKIQEQILNKDPLLPKFHFIPHKYGPNTIEVFDDLEALKILMLVKENDSTFEITKYGINVFEKIKSTLGKDTITKIEAIKSKYNINLDELLTTIYAEHPEYFVKSDIEEILKNEKLKSPEVEMP
ncbi:MAG: hypothetical protein QXT77_05955 [Candidatus Methanomethylicaceae archaeon]